MRGLYFDYAATTPLSREAAKAMKPFLSAGYSGNFGNPSALHVFGRESLSAIDSARTSLAKALGCAGMERSRSIVFTSGATEANNMALRGAVRRARETGIERPRVVISATEHESVHETARDLEREGIAECVVVPVSKEGIVDIGRLRRAIDERTALVSVMYVNNETGCVQPIAEISEIVRNFRNSKPQASHNKQISNSNKRNEKRNVSDLENSDLFENPSVRQAGWKLKIGNYETSYPLFHVDAVQAFQYFDCNPDELGADLMTLSAHKMYGPKGVGALYGKDLGMIAPLVTGGVQESGMRAGTENVAGIAGFAAAAEEARAARGIQAKKTRAVKRAMWRAVREVYPRAEINGEGVEGGSPHVLNVWFPGIPNELLLIQLDDAGIAASAGSACHARVPQPSRVLREMHGDVERAKESVRFSFGKYTKSADIKTFSKVFGEIIQRYKA